MSNIKKAHLNSDQIKDIIEWDILNWEKCIHFWSQHENVSSKTNECLEIGGRSGGLSLWLALNGNNVICTDLNSHEEQASRLHKKYNCQDKVSYLQMDATNIPFENKFDFVVFKSVLGGIGGGGNDQKINETLNQIYKALKPGGTLLFAENLEASALHNFFRKTFVKWAKGWRYLKYKEIEATFSIFDHLQYETNGFFGTFGRSEKQRQVLGKLDKAIGPLIPKSKKYIVYGIAKKK